MYRNRRFKISFFTFFVVLACLFLISCGLKKAENQTDLHTQDTTSLGQQNQKVLIVTGDYIPYVAQSKSNDGFFSEIVIKTLSDCNIDYEIQYFPWARCSEMVKSGKAWATFPFAPTKAREQIFYFSDPIYKTNQKFYYWKDNKKLTNEFYTYFKISDFKGYIFGGTTGYWYGTRDDISALGVKSEWAGDTYALLKMLRSGRIDFLIEDELVCDAAIKTSFSGQADKFSTLSSPAMIQDYLLIASKNYPDSRQLLNKFNASLQKLKESGEFERILKNNGIPDNTK